LLGTYDEYSIWILHCSSADADVFLKRQREWLLTEDVLASLQGFDGDLGVPVIWRNDGDYLNVFAIKQFAVVFVHLGFAFADLVTVASSLHVVGINIANSYDIAKVRYPLGVAGSHATRSNAANNESVVS
jgi:hypothetical protein